LTDGFDPTIWPSTDAALRFTGRWVGKKFSKKAFEMKLLTDGSPLPIWL
jgi:hypothetical protein